MVVKEYVHLFKADDGTAKAIPTSKSSSNIKLSAVDKADEKTLGQGLTTSLANNAISNTLISPLNSATGGLASPVYSLGKSIAMGAGAAAIGGGIAGLMVAGVMLAVTKMQERIQKMEAKAEQANNRDNALIRAGVKSYATDYTGNLSGVKSIKRG